MAKLFGKNDRADRPEVIGRDVIDASSSALPIDERRYARFGWWVVLIGFVGFILWAAFAPLDQGVPSVGTVIVSGKRQAVQNLTAGLVDRLLVRDGDVVKAGDVVVKLNTVQVQAELDGLRQRAASLQAMASRLEAEREGSATITFPEALREAGRAEPRAAESMRLQEQLFQARRTALRTDLAAVDESLAALRADIAGLESVIEARTEEQKMLQEQLVGLRELARDGYVPRNRLLDQESNLSRLNASLAESRATLLRGRAQLQETTLRRRQRLEEFQRDVRTDLADIQHQLSSVDSSIAASEFTLVHADVRSPADGVVVGLQVHTQGAVLGAGTHLMDIVPQGEPLQVEVQVLPHLIDKVHVGLPVELMFTAFNQRSTPHIPGEVRTVAADIQVDPATNVSYYRVEVEVTPQGEAMLAKNQVRPGMGVEVLIKTGERSMLNYLFRPIIDRANTALVQE